MAVNSKLLKDLKEVGCPTKNEIALTWLIDSIHAWFREIHNIHIEPRFNRLYDGYELYVISKAGVYQYYDDLGDSVFKNRDTLAEEGIRIALEMLNDNC